MWPCLWFFLAAVHCEGFSGGEYGEDPEEETGPDGEGIRIHQHWQEDISHRWHRSSDGAVDVWYWTWTEALTRVTNNDLHLNRNHQLLCIRSPWSGIVSVDDKCAQRFLSHHFDTKMQDVPLGKHSYYSAVMFSNCYSWFTCFNKPILCWLLEAADKEIKVNN